MFRIRFPIVAGLAASVLALPAHAQTAADDSSVPLPARAAPPQDMEGQTPARRPDTQGVDRTMIEPRGERAGTNVTGTGAAGGGARGLIVECLPTAPGCPIAEGDGERVVTTDDLPLGSERADYGSAGETVDESSYPTSPGFGNLPSGTTGAPTGPTRDPTLGIGR